MNRDKIVKMNSDDGILAKQLSSPVAAAEKPSIEVDLDP